MPFRRSWIAPVSLGLAATPTYALTIILNFNGGSSVNPAQDPAALGLQALFDHAESYYEDVFEDSHTITINFWYENLGAPLYSHVLVSQGGVPNRETVANIRINNSVPWFIDPTPTSDTEFDMAQVLWRDIPGNRVAWYNNIGAAVPETFEVGFNGPASAGSPAIGSYDMLTVVMKAVGNALGMSAANTATQVETVDGDYDYDPGFLLGQSLAIEVSPSSIAFVENPEAMMSSGGFGLSQRSMPSHSDLFAMAAGHSYSNLDVPRREWYAGTSDWNTDSNWAGGWRPGSLDDVYVRDNGSAGTITANLSSPGFAANLVVAEAANVDTNDNKLDVNGTAICADFNSDIIVDPSGEFEADALIIENDAELFVTGGLVDVNTLTNNVGCSIRQGAPGPATLDVATNFNNEGTLTSGGNSTLLLTSTGGNVWDLDGFSTGDGVVQANSGSISVIGGLTDSFNGTMSVMNGNSLSISAAWTLSTGAIVDLNDGMLDGGAITMTNATIDVTGSNPSTVNAPIVFSGSPSITVAGPGPLNFTNTVDVTGQLSFDGGEIGGSDIMNAGSIAGSGEISSPIDNNGTIAAVGGTLHLSGAPDLDGTGEAGVLNVVDGDMMVDDAFLFFFNGTCTIGAGRTYTAAQGLSLNTPGQLTMTAGSYAAGTFENLNGTLNVNAGGASEINAAVIRFQTDSVNNINAFLRLIGSTTVDGDAALAGSGQLGVPNGSSIRFLDGVNVAIPVQSSGTTSIGASPGIANLAEFHQGANGTLEIEIGGTQVGTQYDRLRTVGATSLDGTLDLQLIGGFVPVPTQTFRVMSMASRSGEFAAVTGATDAIVTYGPDFVRIRFAECPGDMVAPLGLLDAFDVIEYLGRFDAMDPVADMAAPFGVWDVFDVIEYLSLFDAGC